MIQLLCYYLLCILCEQCPLGKTVFAILKGLPCIKKSEEKNNNQKPPIFLMIHDNKKIPWPKMKTRPFASWHRVLYKAFLHVALKLSFWNIIIKFHSIARFRTVLKAWSLHVAYIPNLPHEKIVLLLLQFPFIAIFLKCISCMYNADWAEQPYLLAKLDNALSALLHRRTGQGAPPPPPRFIQIAIFCDKKQVIIGQNHLIFG